METFRPQTTSPNCVRLVFSLDSSIGWYVPVVYPLAFNRIPRRLKIERRQFPKIHSNLTLLARKMTVNAPFLRVYEKAVVRNLLRSQTRQPAPDPAEHAQVTDEQFIRQLNKKEGPDA